MVSSLPWAQSHGQVEWLSKGISGMRTGIPHSRKTAGCLYRKRWRRQRRLLQALKRPRIRTRPSRNSSRGSHASRRLYLPTALNGMPLMKTCRCPPTQIVQMGAFRDCQPPAVPFSSCCTHLVSNLSEKHVSCQDISDLRVSTLFLLCMH